MIDLEANFLIGFEPSTYTILYNHHNLPIELRLKSPLSTLNDINFRYFFRHHKFRFARRFWRD